MAITSTGFQSPATTREGLKPSVYDQIKLLGADETPLLSLIGKSVVKGIEHSWLTDTLAQPKKNARLEISDFSGDGKSTIQKTSNAVQIATTDVSVSKTMQKVATYGGKELQREISKKGKEHKLDLEFALFGLGRDSDAKKSVFKAPTIRTEAIAGESAGLFYYASKGKSAFTNGKAGNIIAFDASKDWKGAATAMSEDMLMQTLQIIYDNGGVPKDVFVGAELKKAINKIVQRQLGNEKKANTRVVSLETDFGTVNFRLHRFLSEQYGLGDVLIAGDFEYMKNGLLYSTELEKVTTSKTATQYRYYTEFCLEVRNADGFAIAVGLKA